MFSLFSLFFSRAHFISFLIKKRHESSVVAFSDSSLTANEQNLRTDKLMMIEQFIHLKLTLEKKNIFSCHILDLI